MLGPLSEPGGVPGIGSFLSPHRGKAPGNVAWGHCQVPPLGPLPSHASWADCHRAHPVGLSIKWNHVLPVCGPGHLAGHLDGDTSSRNCYGTWLGSCRAQEGSHEEVLCYCQEA